MSIDTIPATTAGRRDAGLLLADISSLRSRIGRFRHSSRVASQQNCARRLPQMFLVTAVSLTAQAAPWGQAVTVLGSSATWGKSPQRSQDEPESQVRVKPAE